MVVTAVAAVVTVVAIGLSVAGPSVVRIPCLNIIMGPDIRLGPVRECQHRRFLLVVELLKSLRPTEHVSLIPRRKLSHRQLMLVVSAPAPVSWSVTSKLSQLQNAFAWVGFHLLVTHVAHHFVALIAPVYDVAGRSVYFVAASMARIVGSVISPVIVDLDLNQNTFCIALHTVGVLMATAKDQMLVL